MRSFVVRNLLIMLIVLLGRILTRGTVSDSNHELSSSLSSYFDQKISATIAGRTDYVADALGSLDLTGTVEFQSLDYAATDFGGIYRERPAAVVKPGSVEDIVKVVSMAALSDHITVAARGNGHSINGQAMAKNGVVLDMTSLKGIEIFEGNVDETAYADVYAGELWIDVLKETLKKGLAPRSWTDYLPLSVGGTLSNGGVSGQTFKFGPQISNVLQLQLVTGKGEAITCSPEKHADLFYGALGGLGQFAIITQARIVLQRAPHMVRWMRFVYSDFEEFRADQERLILVPQETEGETFDYVEGFVLTNNADPANGWPSVPLSSSSSFDFSLIPKSAGPMLYCLEVALHYEQPVDSVTLKQRIGNLVAPLRFIEGLNFSIDLTYFDFLNRVHAQEVLARSIGTWHAPHPWLNIFIPSSRIADFDATVFRQILSNGVGGPILVYPMSRTKWDMRMSAVVPEEEVFYLVALLRFNQPQPAGPALESIQGENQKILDFCKSAGIDLKLYLPHYKTDTDWRAHFSRHWQQFLHRKALYDPSSLLAPGQHIFTRASSPSF